MSYKPESDFDRAMRDQREAVRAERNAKRNDGRRAAGLSVQHCGVDAELMNRHGDYRCRKCGEVGF